MRKPDLKGLTKLARVLSRTKKEHFDMTHWIRQSPCGTSACIAGHAAAIFPSRFRRIRDMEDDTHTYYKIQHRTSGYRGPLAFAKGFNISLEDAELITIEHMWRTPKTAAKAVMTLVGNLKKSMKK